ncbi:MAG: hypothetical protein ACO3N6_03755 [bacterium]|jgi:hypothetical protein
MTDHPPLEATSTADDMLHVCLTLHGFTACCYVSSHHLVDCKRKQLKAAIMREAMQAYESTTPLHDC